MRMFRRSDAIRVEWHTIPDAATAGAALHVAAVQEFREGLPRWQDRIQRQSAVRQTSPNLRTVAGKKRACEGLLMQRAVAIAPAQQQPPAVSLAIPRLGDHGERPTDPERRWPVAALEQPIGPRLEPVTQPIRRRVRVRCSGGGRFDRQTDLAFAALRAAHACTAVKQSLKSFPIGLRATRTSRPPMAWCSTARASAFAAG